MKLKLFSALVLALALNSCADDTPSDPGDDNITTTFSTATKIGDDTARTFVRVDDNGNPTGIGIAIDADALMNIPDGHPIFGNSWTLALPNEANAKLPFKHVTLDWNKMGHEPVMFEVPHFDMHFYTITETEKMAIQLATPGDTAKMYKDPNASDIPADYTGYVTIPGVGTMPVGGVPMMGWHFSDSTDATNHGGHAFDHVFIYGFYNAKMNFMEPMITKAFLDSKASVTRDIKQPQTYLTSGNYWPTKYTIRFDAAANQHIIEMHGMMQR